MVGLRENRFDFGLQELRFAKNYIVKRGKRIEKAPKDDEGRLRSLDPLTCELNRGYFTRRRASANAIGVDVPFLSILTPFRGTPLYEQLLSSDRILNDRDWPHYNGYNVAFRPAQMTPEQLLEAHRALWRQAFWLFPPPDPALRPGGTSDGYPSVTRITHCDALFMVGPALAAGPLGW